MEVKPGPYIVVACIKLLRTIQQRNLRSILKIRWDHFITNDEVLDRAKSIDIEIILTRNRLRWLGHVARMPDERPVKAPFSMEY